MADLADQILAQLRRKGYQPLTPRELARRLGLGKNRLAELKRALRDLLRDGRIEVARNHTIRAPKPHGTITGTFRRTTLGVGFVRPQPIDGRTGPEVRIREDDTLDAATGDVVLVQIMRKPNRPDLL